MGILRTLLAISVVVAHTSPIFGLRFVGGRIAVESFFIISGFYMSLILNEKYFNKKDSYRLFIVNRFLRLYPVYWVVLFLSIVFSVVIYLFSSDQSIMGQISLYIKYLDVFDIGSLFFIIFANFFLFLQDLVMFLGLDLNTGNLFFTSNFAETNPQLYSFLFIPQAWTLGVELMFYLIAPVILKKGFKIVLLVMVASVGIRLVLLRYGLSSDPWSYRFFPSELFFFLLGYVAYRIYDKVRGVKFSKVFLGGILVFMLMFTIFLGLFQSSYIKYSYFLFFFLSVPFIFLATRHSGLDRYIGELSYPIYISHILVSGFFVASKMPVVVGLGFDVSVYTILISMALNEFVAKKVEKIRQQRVVAAGSAI